MSGPRIVYLHQYFKTLDDAADSGGTRSFEFARRLADDGYEVHVVAAERFGTHPEMEELAGFTIHWVTEPYDNTMSFARRMRSFVAFAWKAGRVARRLKGDLVLASSTPLTIIIPAVMAARRAPIVFEVRDLWPEMPIAVGALKGRISIAAARWLERYAYRRAAELIALSPGQRAGIVARGIDAERVTLVPNAADLDLFDVDPVDARAWHRAQPFRDRSFVLYCGTFGILNDLSYFVHAAASAARIDPALAFVLIGNGSEREHLRELARSLGVLDENLWILPPVAKTEAALAFAASTISTSLFAPIPAMESNSANKFFDGLAAGKPVAVNYGGWHRELIASHEAGLLLPPRDPEGAAGLLVGLARDRDELARRGRNARALATSEFSRQELYERWRSALQRALPTAPP